MATPTPITRAAKKGHGTTTYVGEMNASAPNDAPIYASDVDGDLDPVYAAFNNLIATMPTALPPNGPATGDLTGSYPAPSIAPAVVTTAKLVDGAATRAKIGPDAWLPPVPSGGNVGQVLSVASGPALAYVAPPGGPPTGAAGGDLAGAFPSPTIKVGAVKGSAGAGANIAPASIWAGNDIAAGSIASGLLAPGASVRQIVTTTVPANFDTASGSYVDVVAPAITTSGGVVALLGMGGWWFKGPANTDDYLLLTWVRDAATTVLVVRYYFNASSTGTPIVPLPPIVAIDQPAAGAHTYHLQVATAAGTIHFQTAPAGSSGACWAIEFA